MNSKNICLILSGSIAAYKACDLTSRLVKAGHTVQVVATAGALRFVGEATLEGLSGRPVYTDLWARNENMTHITLRRWADIFVFYPASANRINQMAAGIAEDLLGALFLANNFEKPFWIAPAMNTGMLNHPATQSALTRLQDWGCRIISGESGTLACGDIGAGRLVEPAVVEGFIRAWALPGHVDAPRRVMVTGGAMSEPIDAVRSITNSSTGRTASEITRCFLDAGWIVDYLHHQNADLNLLSGDLFSDTRNRLNTISYLSFKDFDAALTRLLSSHAYQAIIHAAAVSDYHVEAPTSAKLESTEGVTVKLLPNPKLLRGLRDRAKGKPVIVGFKLTVDAEEKEGLARASAFCKDGKVDLVVWNDFAQIRTAEDGEHPFTLFAAEAGVVTVRSRGTTNANLAQALLTAISTPEVLS